MKKMICAKHFGTFKSCNPTCMEGWTDKQTVIRKKIIKVLNNANKQLGVCPLGNEIASMIDALEGK